MSDDAELLARLKAQADAAWAKATRLAKLADAGIGSRSEHYEALNAAYEASRRYHAFLLPEIPHVRWIAEPVGEERK